MGFVYVMQAGRHFKIGYTGYDARKRLGAIQTSSPVPVYLLGVIPGTMADEARLHEHFADKRAEGEWFSLSWADAGEILHGDLAVNLRAGLVDDETVNIPLVSTDTRTAEQRAFASRLLADVKRVWPEHVQATSAARLISALFAIPGTPYKDKWSHLSGHDLDMEFIGAMSGQGIHWGTGWVGTERAGAGYMRSEIFGEQPQTFAAREPVIYDNSISPEALRAHVQREWRELKARVAAEAAERSEMGRAQAFLRESLASGPRRTSDIESKGASAHGLSQRTLKRARADMRIQSAKRADGWWIALPEYADDLRRAAREPGTPTAGAA